MHAAAVAHPSISTVANRPPSESAVKPSLEEQLDDFTRTHSWMFPHGLSITSDCSIPPGGTFTAVAETTIGDHSHAQRLLIDAFIGLVRWRDTVKASHAIFLGEATAGHSLTEPDSRKTAADSMPIGGDASGLLSLPVVGVPTALFRCGCVLLLGSFRDVLCMFEWSNLEHLAQC